MQSFVNATTLHGDSRAPSFTLRGATLHAPESLGSLRTKLPAQHWERNRSTTARFCAQKRLEGRRVRFQFFFCVVFFF